MVKLSFVGDIFPANLPDHNGFGVAGQFYKHAGAKWRGVMLKYFANSDCVIGNLESPLIYDNNNSHLFTFAGNELFAGFLKDVGFNILSIANNHILEKGKEGFYSTLKALENNGLKAIGIDKQGISSIEYIKKKGIVIGIAAFNAIHDIPNPSLYAELTEESVLKTINNMGETDFKVLVFHWGNEYVNIPSFEQIRLAYRFIDAGADIIIGHHPHVIQPVKRYKHGLIFYSLGNFLFDMTYAGNVRLGMYTEVYLEKHKYPDYITYPIYIAKDYTPKEYDANLLNEKLFEYKKILDLLEEGTEEQYNIIYERLRLRNHVVQRFLMKKDLLISFFKLNNKGRSQSIERIWRKLPILKKRK